MIEQNHTNLGFTQTHSDPLNDLRTGYIQLIAAKHKIETPNDITGIDKKQLNCDCKDLL